jgi:NADP-reducing hydrogenase subunit HndD
MSCAALCEELGLPLGTVSAGKMITTLKRLGFDMVYDAGHAAQAAFAEECRELSKRVKQGVKLPLVSGCSPGWNKFAENFYPDLAEHIFPYRPYQAQYAENTATVFIEPCIARKMPIPQPENQRTAIHLTIQEIARMIKLAGIGFDTLSESAFDELPAHETALAGIPVLANLRELEHGIQEAETVIEGKKIKTLTVNGFARARAVMDSIRAGRCDAALVKVLSCPASDGQCACCALGSLYKGSIL